MLYEYVFNGLMWIRPSSGTFSRHTADRPLASGITNFRVLYPMWYSQEISLIISEVRYNRVRYIEGLLNMEATMKKPIQIEVRIRKKIYIVDFHPIFH